MPSVLQSPHTERILANLQYQGSGDDCGPYTAATLINALCGESLDGKALAKRMNKLGRRGPLPVIRRVPNWATFPWGVVDVLREYGLDAHWWLLTPLAYLRPALANGRILIPIIGEWKPKPWAHFLTLIAWDAVRGWGFANTQLKQPRISWVPDNLFQRRWQNYGRVLVEVERA
jgi:hypothetical protein